MSENQFILGVDGGSQSTKLTIFDLAGNEICSYKQTLRPLVTNRVGHVEHPEDDLWDSLCRASQELLKLFPHPKESIVGIGLCSIRCCRTLLRADGSLASPVQNWMDTRLSYPFTASQSDIAYVSTASGYLTHRLTGQFKDTAANYEGPWPLDKTTGKWSAEQSSFSACGVEPYQLFELIPAGSIAGRLTRAAAKATGLAENTPVVVTANDKAVEALGCGLTGDNGRSLFSFGTYITSMRSGRLFTPDGQHYFCNMASLPGEYLYESNGIRYGMSTITWLTQLFGMDEPNSQPEQQLNTEANDIPLGSEGLYTLPNWLASPSAPHQRGALIGLNQRHRRAHLFRSALEGIALTMFNNYSAMNTELELAQMPDQLIVSGGGSTSDLLMHILADVFNLQTQRTQSSSQVALGAAINCTVGLGIYANYQTAINTMVRLSDQFEPNSEHHEQYQKINQSVFNSISPAIDPILQNSHHLSF